MNPAKLRKVEKNRFWIYWNQDFTCLTLPEEYDPSREDETIINLCHSEPTDEGWERLSICIHREGNWVYMNTHRVAKDCDGKFEQFYSERCHIKKLKAVTNNSGFKVPQWIPIKESQRDYFAERAGY